MRALGQRLVRGAAVVAALVLVGCASGGRSAGAPGVAPAAGEPAARGAPRVLVAGMQTDPRAFNTKVARGTASGPIRGGPELEWLLNSGLTMVDEKGVMRGQLAETPPTVENGGWRLFPDGRMETTWRIRDGAQWHDGTPFTSDDLIFTAKVVQDPEVAAFRELAYDLIETVEAPDPRTITVRWKGPTIEADRMFSQRLAVPMPRHLLEPTYLEDKGKVLYMPYWLGEFVGTGPYRLRTWTQGSGVILDANPAYVLGKPKIDVLDVRFITDPNTLVSNLFAGSVDLTLGYGLSLEPALQLRNQWPDGKVEMAPNGWIPAHPQFLNPRPAIIADLRFRQALMRALDRQEMTETLQAGLVQVAHAFLDPADPDYPAVADRLMRYEYDPARAIRGLQELGYVRGEDGGWTDSTGERLTLEIQTVEGLDIQVKATLAVADAWQRIGIPVQQIVRSASGNPDREANATFPGFRLIRQPNAIDDMKQYFATQAPTAENRFVGQNFSRYTNPEYTGLVERYFRTIPKNERTQLLGDILHHQSEQLNIMGLFYNVQSVAIGKRAQNVTNSGVLGFNQAWNAHEWDVK
jgi:peptide/nickel transport system substrate-binding protein